MDIDARDIAKITDNIKENYDRSISDAQKINLDEILVKYYDWWRCRQFLRNILYFETTPQLYSYLIGYATYGEQELYQFPCMKYLLRIINDLLIQFEQLEENGYLAFIYECKEYSLKITTWRFLFVKDTLEDFLENPNKLEYISEKYEETAYDEYVEYLYQKKEIPNEQVDAEAMLSSNSKQVNGTSNKNRTAVLYYMLRSKLDLETIIKIANYVTNKDYDITNKANNSAYKYIHKPELFREKNENIAYIVQALKKYGFEVPKELE